MQVWRNWQTRWIQVPVGNRAGSIPVTCTISSVHNVYEVMNTRFFCFNKLTPFTYSTSDDHPFVILPSAEIYCSKTASNLFSHPHCQQRCNTLHFAKQRSVPNVPFGFPKKSIYLQLRRSYILFFLIITQVSYLVMITQ